MALALNDLQPKPIQVTVKFVDNTKLDIFEYFCWEIGTNFTSLLKFTILICISELFRRVLVLDCDTIEYEIDLKKSSDVHFRINTLRERYETF